MNLDLLCEGFVCIPSDKRYRYSNRHLFIVNKHKDKMVFNKCLRLARRKRKTNKFLKEKQARIIINDDKLILELGENSYV